MRNYHPQMVFIPALNCQPSNRRRVDNFRPASYNRSQILHSSERELTMGKITRELADRLLAGSAPNRRRGPCRSERTGRRPYPRSGSRPPLAGESLRKPGRALLHHQRQSQVAVRKTAPSAPSRHTIAPLRRSTRSNPQQRSSPEPGRPRPKAPIATASSPAAPASPRERSWRPSLPP